jgi:hypothetical protein
MGAMICSVAGRDIVAAESPNPFLQYCGAAT